MTSKNLKFLYANVNDAYLLSNIAFHSKKTWEYTDDEDELMDRRPAY